MMNKLTSEPQKTRGPLNIIGEWLEDIARFIGGITKLIGVIPAFVVGMTGFIFWLWPPTPIDPPPPDLPVTIANITGKWADPQGNYMLFQQQGKRLTYQSYDASEHVTSRGTGKLDERTVQLRGIMTLQGQSVRYTGQFTLADDDDEMTGRLTPNDELVNLFTIIMFGSGETTLTKE